MIAQPQPIRGPARDHAPREDQLLGLAFADELAQAIGPACPGDNAETGFWQADLGDGGEDAEGGREGELEAAAKGDRGYGGYGGDAQVGNGGEGAAEVIEELLGPESCFGQITL